MTRTAYDPTFPTDRDRVRWRIGDTDEADPRTTDEEVAEALTSGGSVIGAAVLCVRALLAKYSREDYDRTAVGITSNVSQRFAQYQALLTELTKELSSGGPGAGTARIFAGGVSIAATNALKARSDFPKSKFSLGRDDYT